MCNYSEAILRKKAKAAGYAMEKGFRHCTISGAIYTISGERITGYVVKDLAKNEWVQGCYDEHYTHLWQLEDVEEFLKHVYESNGLKW